jgi:hypothetical protein
MATLLESLAESFTPDLLGKIAGSTGLDTNLVSKGLGAVGPLLTGALARKSATPTGLDGLMNLIPSDGGAILGNLASLVGGGSAGSLLSGIFGNGLGAAGKTLDQKLGFNASSLLGVAGPAVMGLLSKVRSEGNLDRAGVAKLLQDQQAAFAASGGENASLVESVLDAGAEAEAIRGRYSDEEWLKVRLAPMAAAQVVMTSSPSGPIGTIKEATAVVRAIGDARKDAAPTSILGLAFDQDLSLDDLKTLGGKAATKENLLGVIKSAVATVAAKSPSDAASYRRFLTSVATGVAEASKEGGFLGIGGTLVSDSEKVAIEEVTGAAM